MLHAVRYVRHLCGALDVTWEVPETLFWEQRLMARGYVVGHLEDAGHLNLGKPSLNHAGKWLVSVLC